MQMLAKLIGFTLVLSSSAWASDQPAGTTKPTSVQGAATSRADNTEMNERDKSGATKTAQKQTNREEDRKLLAAVRRAVVDEKTLSTSAHNVKIVVLNGVLTLRGPVNNESEKKKVEELANQVAGVTNVVNQLDIKTK